MALSYINDKYQSEKFLREKTRGYIKDSHSENLFYSWMQGAKSEETIQEAVYDSSINKGALKFQHKPAVIDASSGRTVAVNHFYKPERLDIKIENKVIDSLNPVFNDLFESINRSKSILRLEENWDEEGSKGFKDETWISVVKFLVTYFNAAYDIFGEIVKTPSIFPSENGSIDVLWNSESYRLLVNIQEDSNVITFYGDDRKNTSIKGSCDISLETHKGLILTLLDCS